MLDKRKGQSTVEYALIVGVIVASLIAMQTYVKRGLNARYHDGVNFLTTETAAIGSTNQYEPYYVASNYDTQTGRQSTETVGERGQTTRSTAREETTRRAGGQSIYGDTANAD